MLLSKLAKPLVSSLTTKLKDWSFTVTITVFPANLVIDSSNVNVPTPFTILTFLVSPRPVIVASISGNNSRLDNGVPSFNAVNFATT